MILLIASFGVLSPNAVAQCTMPVNDGQVQTTGSGQNPATTLAPFTKLGSTTAGVDETRVFLYMNTVNQFDIPAELTSMPAGNAFGDWATYSGKGQQLVANFGEASAENIIFIENLEPSSPYYFQMVKVSVCGTQYVINDSIIAAQNMGRTTHPDLSENITVKDIMFGTIGDNAIQLNSFTGITSPTTPTGYVIKMNTTNTFTPVTDGTSAASLTANTVYGGGEQIVYVGDSVNPDIDITGLSADTEYYFKVYGYYGLYYQQNGYTVLKSTTTAKPKATITLTGGTNTSMKATVGDADIFLSAITSSSSSLIYQIVEAPYYTTLTPSGNNATITLAKAGTIVVDIIAPGDGSVATVTEQITITVDKATPSITFDNFTALKGKATSIPFSTDSDGAITYNIIGSASGDSLTGAYNHKLEGVTEGSIVLIKAVVAESDYYKADSIEAYATVVSNTFYLNSTSGLLKISDGVATTLVDYTVDATSTGSVGVYVENINGKLWGTTYYGGAYGKGVIFMVDPDGNNFTKIADLNSTASTAQAYIPKEIAGKVWGVNQYGGATEGKGEVWMANTDGTGFTIIHTFNGTSGLRHPVGNLVSYNGKIYGVAESDPTYNGGIFSFNTDGTGYTVEYMGSNGTAEGSLEGLITHDSRLFGASSSYLWSWRWDGGSYQPKVTDQYIYLPTLVDNTLYATCGYPFDSGKILKIASDYSSATTIFSFNSADDVLKPLGELIYEDGRLWGVAKDATDTYGVVYSILPNGKDLQQEYKSTVAGTFSGKLLRKINKISPTLTLADSTVNGLAIYTINAVTNSNEDVAYELIGDITGSSISGDQLTTGGVKGTVTIRATIAANDYFDAATVDATFTIDRINITASDITFNAPVSLVYDATEKTYTVTTDAGMSPALPVADIELTYEGRNGTIYTSSSTAPTNAGDYTVTATVKESNADYVGNVSTDFTITPFATTISLNLPGSNPEYTGTGQGITPTANDVSSNPTLTLTTEYSISGANSFSTILPINAGNYDVRANIASSESNYTASEVTGTFTIDKAAHIITFNAIPEIACSQSTIDLSNYATSNTGATLTFSSSLSDVATVSGNILTIIGGGTATIIASHSGDANNLAAASKNQTLTVAASQESYAVDNPSDVLICDGSIHTLPALTEGNYFSEPGGAGTTYNAGDDIAASMTMYVYGVSATSNACVDENSFEISINNLPVDALSDVVIATDYSLPVLTNGNYFTGSGGTGSALNAGDAISSTQTIYIYNEDIASGCTRESSFDVFLDPSNALHFNRVVSPAKYDYLTVADDNSLDVTSHFTFEAWVNFDQLTDNGTGYGWRTIFQKSTYTHSYGLMLYAPTKNLVFYHNGVSPVNTSYTWSSLTAGSWHHVAVKWDDSNSKTSILIDGVEVASRELMAGSINVNTEPIYIGGSSTGPYPFDGAMDEIRLWNIARTDTEILNNKDTELTGSETGLVLYYNFDEGIVDGDNTGLSQVTDRSGNNNHATFNNFILTGTESNYVDGSGTGVTGGLPQSITFNALSNVTYGDADFNLSASASSGLDVSFSSSNTSVATVTGNTVTIVGAGTTSITASQAGNGAYLAAVDVNQTLTVDPFATSIAIDMSGTPFSYNGSPQGITAEANDQYGNPTLPMLIEYSVYGAGSYSTTPPTDAGFYEVQVNLGPSETNYAATEVTRFFNINKIGQTITFNSIPEVACGQTTIDLSLYASSDKGTTLTFASDNPAVVTISGNIATITGSGSATFTASQAGTVNYLAATDQQQTLTVAAVQENYTVDNLSDALVCDGSSFTLPALTEGNYFSGPGGTGTTYNTGDNISASTTMYIYGVSAVNVTCTDENNFSIDINNIQVDNLPDVIETNSYTLPVLTNGNYYTGSGGTGTALSAGELITSTQTIYVYHNDAGSGCTSESSFDVTIQHHSALHYDGALSGWDYIEVADDANLDFTTNFTFEAWVNFDQVDRVDDGWDWQCLFAKSRYNESYGLMMKTDGGNLLRFYHPGFGTDQTDYTWTPSASTWYHIAVSLSSTKAAIIIDGVEVASQTGSGSLTPNNNSLMIGAGSTGGIDPYPVQGTLDDVRFWNISRDASTINAEKSEELIGSESGLVLYYNFSDGVPGADNTSIATINDLSSSSNDGSLNTFTLTGTSSNFVDASANGVGIGTSQSITFNALSDKTYGDADFTLGATASSGLAISYTSSNTSVATVSGNTVTIVGAGTANIYASQAGDATYEAAPNVKQTLTVNPIAIEITAEDKSKYLNHTDPELTYTITNGSLINGDKLSGSLVRENGETSGTYAINQGTLTAGTNYSISFVPGVFTIENISPQTISFTPITSPVYGDTIKTGVSASSGLDVTLTSSDPLIARISNDTIFMDSVGTVTITASQAGNAAFLAAPDSVLTFTVGPKLINAVPKDTTVQYGALYLPIDGTLDYPIAFDGLVKASDTSSFVNFLPNVRAYVSDLSSPAEARIPGTYDLVWDGTNKPAFIDNSGKYNIATAGAGSVTVVAAPVTVTADSITKVYDNGVTADPALSYTLNTSGLINDVGTIDYSSDFVLSGALTRTSGQNVGVYPINQGTLVTSSNYAINFESDDFVIIKDTITVELNPLYVGLQYGEEYPIVGNPLLTYSGFASGDTEASLNTLPVLSTVVNTTTNAGVYPYTIDGGVDDNYAFKYVNGNITVSKRGLLVTLDNLTLTYGDALPTNLDYSVTGFVNGEDTSVFTTHPVMGYNTSPKDAGTYNSELKLVTTFQADNYFWLGEARGTLTINKRDLTVTPENTTLEYGAIGANDYPVTYSGFQYGEDESVLTIGVGSPTVTFIDETSPTLFYDAGATYANAIKVEASSQAAMTSNNYNLVFETGQLTVTQRLITFTADAKSKVYGDADPTFTTQVTAGSFATGDTVNTFGFNRASGEDVGTYLIDSLGVTLKKSDNTDATANYDITYMGDNLTINQKAIVVAADAKSKTYGDADPALTYQIITGSLVGSDVLSGSLARAAGEDVGTYAISQSTLDNSNYSITFVSDNLTISKKAIEVTADAKSKTYGDVDPALTYSITNGSLVGSDAFTGSLTRITGEDVGTYAINQGTLSAGSNYNLSFVSSDLTIDTKAIEVTSDVISKIYGETDPALTYTITYGALVGSDTFSGSLSRDAGEDVGTYAISQNTLALSSNYDLSFVDNDFTISQRPIEVTANDKTKFEGAADPALDYTITSGSLAFSDVLTGSLTRDAGETVGTYAINQGTLSATANYNMSFIPGTLTITDLQTQTITFAALADVIYGGADFNLTATGGASGNPVTFTSSDETVATVSGNTVTIVGAGSTVITASQAGNATYAAAADVNQTLTVDPIALTVRADAISKTYGDLDPALTYQITSGVLIGSDVLTGSLVRITGEDVGTYAIEQGSLDNDNYDISYIGDNFTITQRFIELTADLSSKTYGDADPVFTYQVTTGTVIDSDVFTGDMIRTTGEDVGTYTISQGTLDNSNYDISFVGNDFIINPCPLEITADAASKVYGDTDPAFTYQITSGSLVGSDAFAGSLTRTMGEDVGTYAIEQGTVSAGANYNLSFVSGDLTIGTKAIEVSADAISKIYGETDPALTYSVTIGSLVGSDTFTGSLIRTAGEDVGTYAITQNTLALSSNYSLSFVGNNLTVTQRSIEVTANDITKFEGSADPALTYSITNGNLVFSDAISGTPERVAGETVGTYAINQGTVSAGANYNMNFVPGTFTITDLMLQTITFDALADVTYGDANFDLTATGGGSGNPVTFTSSDETVATVSGNTVTIIGAGTTIITASQAGNATYAVAADVPQALVVNPRSLIVVADGVIKYCGETDPELTYQIVDGSLVGSDVFTGSLTRDSGEEAGFYGIEQGSLSAGDNYTIIFLPTMFTINLRESTLNPVICEGDYYESVSGTRYDTEGLYTETINNPYGCDSIIHINLTVNSLSAGIDVIMACDSYTWIDGITYTESNNIATYVLTNSVGCDSIVTLDLTINNSISSDTIAVECGSFEWYGTVYTESTVVSQNLTTVNGCDSVVTLNLTILNPTYGTDIITTCDSYTWIDGVTYTESNNIATHVLINSAGCDSIVTLDLRINNSVLSDTTAVACESFEWYGTVYTESTTVTQTFTTIAGCDSIVTLNLTIIEPSYSTDIITACDSYTWIDGVTYTESNNTATFVLTSAMGCDSIVTLDLTINHVINTVTISGTTITADETDATYQWLNCDDNYSVIDGETGQSFTAYISGNYALRVEKNGCVDTSECVNITVTGIESIFSNTINIYPNPTNGQVNIDFEKTVAKFNVNVRDVTGKLVRHESYVSASEARFYFEGHQGVYFIEIYTDSERKIFKIIKSE